MAGVVLSATEASALGRMFCSAVFHDFSRRGASPLFARLVRLTRLSECTSDSYSVAQTLDDAAMLLRSSEQRDDYTYRSALVCKRLLGRHNLRTATMLSEVRTGRRKADVVVLNGTATAYEIKSDRDSLARLGEQIRAYREVFGSVAVLTSAKFVDQVDAIVPGDVGIIELTPAYTLRDLRSPDDQPERVDPVKVLDILRRPEAFAVLNALGVDIPQMPNTVIRGELARIFATLDPAIVHGQMVAVLRQMRSQQNLATFVDSLPCSLHVNALTLRPNATAQQRIHDAIATPLATALTWK